MFFVPLGKYRRTLVEPTCNPVTPCPLLCVLTTIRYLLVTSDTIWIVVRSPSGVGREKPNRSSKEGKQIPEGVQIAPYLMSRLFNDQKFENNFAASCTHSDDETTSDRVKPLIRNPIDVATATSAQRFVSGAPLAYTEEFSLRFPTCRSSGERLGEKLLTATWLADNCFRIPAGRGWSGRTV